MNSNNYPLVGIHNGITSASKLGSLSGFEKVLCTLNTNLFSFFDKKQAFEHKVFITL